MNGHKLTLSPQLAAQIGLNEAIVLQQVYYWIQHYKGKNSESHFHDGRCWVYNTAGGWRKDNFPFWSESTIRRAFSVLCEMGLIIKGRYNSHTYDRTLWYSIDEIELANLITRMSSNDGDGQAQDDDKEASKVVDGSEQDADKETLNVSTPIPETTTDYTETSAEITSARQRDASSEQFEQLFGPQPDYKSTGSTHWSEKPWLRCADWLKPRHGISKDSLQRVYWLIEQHTGLVTTDKGRSGWSAALVECYQAGQGDFDAIEYGIKEVWKRPPEYRPGHVRGFVDEIRKAKAMGATSQVSESERMRQRMLQDPQYQAGVEIERLRRQREQAEAAK